MPLDWGSGFTPPASGGLLGVNPYQYLGDIGFGLLAASGPSTQPQGGLGQALGRAGMYASERQDAGLLNEARRMEITAKAQETSARAALLEGLKKGTFSLPGVTPETAAALISSGNETLLGHLIPQALTPEAQAQIMAGYPAIEKAKLDVKKEEDLQGIEKVTSNTGIDNALEAEGIITRMEKGPIPPGSTSASLAAKLSDPESGLINVSPAVIAQASATILGKPMTTEQAAQWQTDWNRLNKLSAKFITDQRTLQAQQGAVGGQSRQTDFGLSFIEKQNISPTVTGNANRAILRDFIQRQLDIAKVRGWTLDNTGRATDAVKRWDAQTGQVVDYSTQPTETSTAAAPTGATAPTGGGPFASFWNSFKSAPPPAAPAAPAGLPPGFAASPTPPPASPGVAASVVPRAAPPAPPPAAAAPKVYQRWADVKRDEASGKLKGITSITVGGKTYDWQPE